MNKPTREELLAQVDSHTWLYSVDLGEGIQTKGLFGPPHTHIRKALKSIDLQGRKVLDVGCWEGHWSFEIERRGASEVFATDYLVGDPRAKVLEDGRLELPTFRLAHTILNSSIKYYPTTSVYHINDLGIADFDVVVFCGVYYHLKHPLIALTRLREVLKDGGLIIVEGPVVCGPAEPYARFYYHEALGDDASNWWVPTLPCLREWIECSYFELIDECGPAYQYDRTVTLRPEGAGRSSLAPDASHAQTGKPTETIARYAIVARAVRRRDPKYVLPDEDLARYDQTL